MQPVDEVCAVGLLVEDEVDGGGLEELAVDDGREDIKEIVATMTRKGLSASRIGQARLVISAVFNETVRNKKLAESPCTDIPVPAIARAADFILPDDGQLDALAAGLPPDWAATVWLMYGCGLRIGEALAVTTRCRISQDTALRIREQVNPTAQLRPLKFRVTGQFRDIPLPAYVAGAIGKHVAGYGTTPDGYLFQGRRHKHVTRSIEVTHQTYGHLIPTSWNRTRTVFDDARRRQPTPRQGVSSAADLLEGLVLAARLRS